MCTHLQQQHSWAASPFPKLSPCHPILELALLLSSSPPALQSNATQAASGPTRTQPPRPKRKQSPGYTPNGSEAVPDSPRYRTVVRAPRSSPMGTASMTAASAAFPAGSPHRVTVHQWPAGGHSPALASPLPRQALRHSSSPQGRGSGGFGSSGGGYAAGGGYGNGGGSGLLRQDSLGGASEDQLLITTSAPAATAEMRDAMLWPSLPISSAPALGGSMPLPGPLSPLSSLPQSPTGLAPTPLMHLGQLSPAPPPLGRVWGGGLGGALSPIRPLGVLSALSLPGSRAATPAGSPGRFGSPPPLPPIPSFRDLGQLAPALQHATDGGDGPAMLSPGSAALGTLAGIQAQLSSLEAPGVPAAMSSPSLHANGSMSGPMSGPMSTPAGLQHLSLLSFPPLPLIGGGSLQDASGSTPFAFPSFGHGSGITSSMLQAASAAAAASAARAAGASQPAALPAVGCDEHAAPAVSTSPAPVFGVHGAASLGRWWQQGSPARPEGPSQDWLAASLPAADLSAGSVFLA